MNYTTLEQSKKLIELGLDPKTADMHYPAIQPKSNDGFRPVPEVEEPLIALEWYNRGYCLWGDKPLSLKEFCVPCWSLGALFQVIPTKIGKNLDYWLTMETTTACNYVLFYKNIYSNEEVCISSKNKNLLDSAIDLIEKLIQEGFLNTKGENNDQ